MSERRAADGRVGPTSAPTIAAVAAALALRPWLWPAAVAEGARLARPRWWRRWPPLPVPDEALWRFRMETAYGGSGEAVPDAEDVVSFIGWCSTMGRWRRR
ncbi:MAG TPA: hypothetical protein VN768_00300 [Acidimicrobiales bacterium]|nr:hypothetical protein [Acidimicrobiales bacterium]